MSPSHQQWFKFDIPIFDEWIPKLSPEAGILFCVIMRKILAWDNKTKDTISISQLMAASGMKESRVHRALKDLQESGCPLRKIGQSRNGSTYSWGVTPRTPGVSPVTPTTDVSTCNTNTIDSEEQKMNLASSSVLYKNQKTGKPTGEDGLVVKKNSIPEDPATVGLKGQPTSQLLLLSFVNPDTSKTWKLTTRQAESILVDSNGMSIVSILSQIEKSRLNIQNADNGIGYIRGIIKNLAPRSKANEGAKPTKQTSPHTRGPLSLKPPPADDMVIGRRTYPADDDEDSLF
jgi:hypothetical protein